MSKSWVQIDCTIKVKSGIIKLETNTLALFYSPFAPPPLSLSEVDLCQNATQQEGKCS